MCACSCRALCAQWRLWIRPVVFVLYGAVILGLVPYLVYWLATTRKVNEYTSALLVGGIFVFLTIPITLWEIIQHLINYTKPKLQKHIIRILWMVPIYALNAWLVLLYPNLSLYLDTARECYEAYVIYNFMIFLLNFLDDVMDLDRIMETKPQTYHIFPLCCLKPWRMEREFIHRCKHGILQYTVFHLLTTFIQFVCGLADVFEEGNFSPTNAFVYMFVVNNLSQFVAMYCLVLFYKAMRRELEPMSPLSKFLCIKAVVFFSFFQGVGIMFLVKLGVISEVFEGKNVSSVLQNFIICIEMFIAAVVHLYAFSYKPYVDPEYETGNCCRAFMLMWDVSDVQSDFREHVHVVSEGMKRRLHIGGTTSQSLPHETGGETTRLIRPVSDSNISQRYLSTSGSEHDIVVDEVRSGYIDVIKTY